ncbi:MAG: HAD-IIB family hydrolase [Gammaproteobacteria bacterium]|nr:HAD-IIB family hydrolase [Gammaproteobacteria bacterium]
MYLVLISTHGLIRSHSLELGRDSDNGGQIKYVVELARALAQHPEIDQVDLLTRQIFDPKVDQDYAHPFDMLSEKARIVRIPCGPKRYLRKEVLWPYLGTFVDRALKHIREVGRVPDIIHSHYADAGYVGAHLASLLGVPLVHTGHSLGRDKLHRLKNQGMKVDTIESRYNISQRIEAEEYTLDVAARVIASTQQEVAEQYALYDNYQPESMSVIHPGVELSQFKPPGRITPKPPFRKELERFLLKPNKPMILALARPDIRKNAKTLVTAFGEHAELRDIANLVVLVGNRENAQSWDKEQMDVFSELLLLIDKYNLYGHVAYPKEHQPNDVSGLYQLATRSRGVFVNPALTEPFGLTIIEAAASGLPVIATENGGPVEILANCKNGLLIDPHDADKLGETLYLALSNQKRWQRWSKNGIAGAHKHYTWKGHAQRYVKDIKKLLSKSKKTKRIGLVKSRMPTIDRLVICDIDNTLIGDRSGLSQLLRRIKNSNTNIGFGVATGRHLESALQAIKEWNIPQPDLLITSVGTNVHYGERLIFDASWARHIHYRWDAQKAKKLMKEFDDLLPQPKISQNPYKISYFVDNKRPPRLREISTYLRQHDIHANLIYSHGAYLDILPMRASKGNAVRFVADKWGIPVDKILVAGDSGNDEDMLVGDTLGVVVGNYSPELKKLQNRPRVYFATNKYAHGILEGMEHYKFFEPQIITHEPA